MDSVTNDKRSNSVERESKAMAQTKAPMVRSRQFPYICI